MTKTLNKQMSYNRGKQDAINDKINNRSAKWYSDGSRQVRKINGMILAKKNFDINYVKGYTSIYY